MLHHHSVQELEDHLNKVCAGSFGEYRFQLTCQPQLLSRTRKTQVRVKDMALEPMVFCYPDVWLHNFIIDKESNKIAVVDFADASYLPLCFALIVLQWSWGKTERDLTGLISIPKTDNVDVANNVRALQLAQRPMIQSSGVWNRLGFELFGNERLKEEDTRMNETLKDANGHVMSFTYVGPPESLKRGPFNLFKTPPAST